MTILINRETKVLIQGIIGKEGMFHTKRMKDYGTHIVAGVTPGKYGEKVLDIPVYDTVKEVLDKNKIVVPTGYSCLPNLLKTLLLEPSMPE